MLKSGVKGLFILFFAVATAQISCAQTPQPSGAATIENWVDAKGAIFQPTSVFKDGNYLYAAGYETFVVLDITNPTSPVRLGSLNHGQNGAYFPGAVDLAVSGNYAYLVSAVGNSMEVIDISDRSNPTHLTVIVDGGNNIRLKKPTAIEISGNHAIIVGQLSYGILVYDITNPASPVFTASLVFGDLGASIGPRALSVVGNVAYVTSYGQNALEVIDISNPSDPKYISSLPYPDAKISAPWSIATSGNYAYLVAGNQFEVIDVTNPAQPQHVGLHQMTSLTDAKAVIISVPYAYVTSALDNTFAIVDISDPANPFAVSYLSNGRTGDQISRSRDMLISGTYVYVSSYESQSVEIINVTDKQHPSYAAYYKEPYTPSSYLPLNFSSSMEIYNNYAYITDQELNNLTITDVSKPYEPVYKGVVNDGDGGAMLRKPLSLDIASGYAYIASYESNALEIMDLADPLHPVHVASVTNMSSAAVVKVSGNYAYVLSQGQNSLEIIDVSDPTTPLRMGSIADGDGGAKLQLPSAIDIVGDIAYVSSGAKNALEVIDISDRSHPVHKATLSQGEGGALLNYVRDIIVVGDYAFLASSQDHALEVVDVSDPGSPKHKVALKHGNQGVNLYHPLDLFLSGNYLFVATMGDVKVQGHLPYLDPPAAVQIVDLSNPGNPVPATASWSGETYATVFTPTPIFVDGNYLYVGMADNTTDFRVLSVISLFEPVPPVVQVTATTKTSFSTQFFVSGSVTGYRVDVSADDFDTFVDGYENVLVTNNAVTVNGLQSETTYKIRVRSVNVNGISRDSDPISVFVGAPTALKEDNVRDESFRARWEAYGPSTGFYLDVSSDNFATFLPGFNQRYMASATFIDVPVTSGTNYYYRVRAATSNGMSAYSNIISVLSSGTGPPVVLPPIARTTVSIIAAWKPVPGAIKYFIDASFDDVYPEPGLASYTFCCDNYIVPGFKNKDAGTATSIEISGFPEGKFYRYIAYRVRALSAGGLSSNSEVMIARTQLRPPIAREAFNISETSFYANWDFAGYIDSYYIDVVYDKRIPGFDNFSDHDNYVAHYRKRETDGSADKLEVTGLIPGRYQYRVYHGDSDPSEVISVATAGVEAQIDDSTFSVYPNPISGDILTIKINESNIDASLRILNSAGQLAFAMDLAGADQHQIDIGRLTNGIYVVIFDTSEKSVLQRILINR